MARLQQQDAHSSQKIHQTEPSPETSAANSETIFEDVLPESKPDPDELADDDPDSRCEIPEVEESLTSMISTLWRHIYRRMLGLWTPPTRVPVHPVLSEAGAAGTCARGTVPEGQTLTCKVDDMTNRRKPSITTSSTIDMRYTALATVPVILLLFLLFGGVFERQPTTFNRETPVFAVMGETGAGKSAFIKALGGRGVQSRQEPKVGHDVYSCTKNVAWYSANLNGEHIHVIDTPGFDDNSLSDSDILKMLVDALAAMYRNDKHLNGLLYIHDITEVRMKGSEIKNLSLFQKLCGEQSFGNIVLVTNKWTGHDREKAKDEKRREARLRKTFWREMITRGSSVARHDGSAKSAKSIMAGLISKAPIVLHVVRQVVDENLPWNRTDAGKAINKELEKFREKMTKDIEDMNRRLADQDVRSERELQALKEEKQKAEQQLEAIQEQQMLLETKFVAQSETAERLKEQLEQEKARMEANIRGRSRKPWSQMGMSYSTLMAFLISTVLICWVVEGRAVQTIAPTLGLRYLSAFIFFWWKQFYDDSPDATGVLAVFFYVLWRVYATWRQGGLAVADIFRLVPLAVTCCIFLFSLSGNLVMPRHGCGSFQETK